MKILNDQAEVEKENDLRMRLMCAVIDSIGPEEVKESLNQGLDLLHDNLPARLFIQLGYETYLVRTNQKGHLQEVYDEIKVLLKKDQTATIAEGHEGEEALKHANMLLPFLALTLGVGSIMAFVIHNKIQRVKESN